MEAALPDTLVDAYLHRRLVLVTGPGVCGQPGAAALAARVLEKVKQRQGNWADRDFFPRMEALLGRGQARVVLRELQHRHGATYEQSVRDEIGEPGVPPPLAAAIPTLAPMLQRVLSTDLGRTLDVAFLGRWPEFTEPPTDTPRHYLFKLHGTRLLPETWVLSATDYDRVLHRSPARTRFLEGLLRLSTLLFLDFDMLDPELAHLRAALRVESGNAPPHHYAYFSDAACDPEQQQELERDGIEVLSPPDGGGEAGALGLVATLARAQAESPGAGSRRTEVKEIFAYMRGAAAPPWRGTLLVFTANGYGADGYLDLEQEMRSLRELVRHTPMSLEISPAASFPAVIRDLIETTPTIAHFSAHGSASGELELRDGEGVRKVTPEEMARLFEILPAAPRLITFCACNSDDLAAAAARHVAHAVGFLDRIPDRAALRFSHTLYELLLAGQTIALAFDAAALASGTRDIARLHTRQGASR